MAFDIAPIYLHEAGVGDTRGRENKSPVCLMTALDELLEGITGGEDAAMGALLSIVP